MINKVEISNVNTSKLKVLTNAENKATIENNNNNRSERNGYQIDKRR